MESEQNTDTSSRPLPRTKAELLALIQRERAMLEQLIGQLSEAQLVMPDGDDGWSIKDHLMHVALWEQGMAALLRHQPRFEAMGLDKQTADDNEINGLNDLLYRRNQDRGLPEVLADFHRSHQEMLAVLAGLEDADLFKTYSFYQPDEADDDSGEPIMKWVVGDTYGHYIEHREWIQALLDSRQ